MPPSQRNSPARPRYRPDIDGLRAVAIILVVIYHAFPSALRGGFVGVDVFFVISGFLITSLIINGLERGTFSFADFYSRRIRRLFPALILVLAFCLIFGRFALLPGELRRLGEATAGGAGFIENFLLWHEAGYFDASASQKPLLHLWSLGVEEQFYLIFPVTFWYAWRHGRKGLWLVTALLVASLAGELVLTRTDSIGAFYLPFTRFWELMAGALLACRGQSVSTGQSAFRGQFISPGQSVSPGQAVSPGRFVEGATTFFATQGMASLGSVAGLILIVISAISFSSLMPYPGWRAALPVAGSAAIIAAGGDAWVNRALLARPAAVFIGLISYPLYLWHWPLLSFARIMEFGVLSWPWTAGIVAVSVALATLTWQFAERPVRYTTHLRYAVSGLVVVMLLVGFEGHESRLRLGFTPGYLTFLENARHALTGNEDPFAHRTDAACTSRFPQFPKYGSRDPDKGNYFCRLSRDAPPTILVMPDSHSATLWYGLAASLPSEAVANVAMGGCIPFTNRRGAEPDTCHSLDEIVENAAGESSIKALVLDYYLRYYEAGGDYWVDPHADRFSTGTSGGSSTSFGGVMANSITRTIVPFLQHHKQVFFVLDWPDLPFEPESCIGLRPLRLTRRVRIPCAQSRAQFESDNAARERVIMNILKEYPQVHVIDAAQPLCDARWCWAMKQGVPMYFDRSHLSLSGSRYVARSIAPLLREYLHGSPQNAPLPADPVTADSHPDSRVARP